MRKTNVAVFKFWIIFKLFLKIGTIIINKVGITTLIAIKIIEYFCIVYNPFELK